MLKTNHKLSNGVNKLKWGGKFIELK